MDFTNGGWWVVDDTAFPKQGTHSVGVARQYCGVLGKQDNCQVAVSVSLACTDGSLPVAWRLYLPREWAEDSERRRKAGVPSEIAFQTKTSIALEQLKTLIEQGAPRHCVLADAGYGIETAFREGLTALGLPYLVGFRAGFSLAARQEPLPPLPYSGRGNVPTRLRVGPTAQNKPMSIKELAFSLDQQRWEEISWREGSNFTLRSRFARVRVRAAHREHQRTHSRAEEWLLIEWPEGHKESRGSTG